MTIATEGERQTGARPVELDWTAVSKERPLPKAIIGIGPAAKGGIVLPAGEVGILAGPGGGGKSRLVLQIAIRAAAALKDDLVDVFGADAAEPDDAGALTVRGGPVVLVGYDGLFAGGGENPTLRVRATITS